MDGTTHNTGPVRVRFAPSPTGYLHVGGARTAIFNWLFARHTGGTFVLRIEDTDVERSTRESEVSLLDDLRWLGLDWDEGPDAGGSHGPYRQSERLDRYQAAARSLVERGFAYPCFCSDEDLERKKKEAIAKGRPPQYDGACRELSPEEISARRRAGTPETVRFRVPEGTVAFEDLVRGHIEMDTSMVGDFVIVRSNGLPTYNFAAAHDDRDMRITHVLRGEEHLPNTLRQILLYRATGAEPPLFAHVPLILAEDRSKLSKRHGASSVEELRESGYLPGAVVNYLVLLGWSHPDAKEKLSREEMIGAFAIDRVGKAAAVYDPKKLAWMNGLYVRELPLEEWVRVATPFLPPAIRQHYDEKTQRDILALIQDGVERIDQVASLAGVFEDEPRLEPEAAEAMAAPGARDVLAAVERELDSLADPWTPESVKGAIGRAGRETGRKGKELFFPIRAAVTGNLHGPDLSRVMTIKGRESVLGALARALRSES